MHYGNACGGRDEQISEAHFDLDHQQSISSPQAFCNSFLLAFCNSFLPLCPYIKQVVGPSGFHLLAVPPCNYACDHGGVHAWWCPCL
jgi:hypothetical protein